MTIVYSRCSTEDQASNGISIDSQVRICTDEAKRLGCNNIKIIKDEGKSAGNMDRPGLKEIMRLCEEKKVKRIIMLSGDRLSRKMENHLFLRGFFKKHGVEVHYTSQANIDINTAMGIMMDNTFANMSEFQRLQTSDKTKACLTQKVKEGWFPGVAPLGYRNVDNPNYRKGEISKRIIIPDDDTAPLVQDMFDLYATGDYSVYSLAEEMARRGLKSRKGKMLHPSKIYETLRNPLYIGELHWGGIVIKKAKHTPIIRTSLFEMVNRTIAAHNHNCCRKRKYQFLLRGFAFCGVCGRRLTAEWHSKASGVKFGYYHCPKREGCPNAYNQVGEMENQVKEQFKNIQFSQSFVNLIVKKAKKILDEKRRQITAKRKLYQNKRNSLEIKRSNAEDKLLKGVLNDNDFTRIRENIREELGAVEYQLDAIEEQRETKIDEIQEILRFSRNIYDAYDKANYILKRHYLSLFWERFDIKDKKIINAIPTRLFQTLLENKQVIITGKWGERGDSNSQPPHPQCGTLTD